MAIPQLPSWVPLCWLLKKPATKVPLDHRRSYSLDMFVLLAKTTSIALLATFLLTACGKRHPPQPPVERVQQRTEALSGVQRGNQVLLTWPAPLRNAPNSSVQSIRRIDVYRLAEKPSAPLPLTEEEFATRSTLVGSVTYEQIKNAKGTLFYTDTLQLAGEPTRLRYAVRYVNASEQRAAFSNFLLIEPAARIAQPPTLITVDKAEAGMTLTWQAPAANIDGSLPVNLLGYNVYRTDETQSEVGATPLNSTLITGTQYVDRRFKFGSDYKYLVRAVSLGTEGAQAESLNSNIIPVSPRDIYPPSAPGRVTATGSPNPPVMAIFFPANQEPDVAGYNIYRSMDPNLPKKDWLKLNKSLLTKTTFVDDKVEPGKTYYYYVTAVDQTGNVSDPSEVGSDTVP